MPTVETIRSTADLALELERIPDSAHVDWATAALLINTAAPPSRRTMERWRQGRSAGVPRVDSPDVGPPFVPGVGRTARVTYHVGALRAWLKARGAASTMEVSAWRGLTFATLHDAWRNEPWVVSGERILGHVLTVDKNSLDAALQESDATSIELLPMSVVMTEYNWVVAVARTMFQQLWETLLQDAHNASRARAAYCELQGAAGHPASMRDVCKKCGSPLNAHDCRL